METLTQAGGHRVKNEGRDDHRQHTWFLILVLLAVVVGEWLLPLGSSLWLDETGTYWVTNEGWGEVVDRGLNFQGQTVAYFAIVWVTRRLLGDSELVLRLPSLLAMGLATYLLFRLAERLFDREAGLLAAIVFASLGAVAFAAADARPYACTLLALMAATLLLIRWFDSGRRRDAVLYAAFAAATIYLHYLFAVALLVHAACGWYRIRRGSPVRLAQVGIAAGVLVILLLPAIGQFLSLFQKRGLLSSPVDLSLREFVRNVAPPVVVVGLLAGLLVAKLLAKPSIQLFPATSGTDMLVIAWMVAPPFILFGAAHLASASVFLERYVLSAAPGLALAVAWVLRSLPSSPARRAAVATFALVALLSHGGRIHGGEDWRTAAARVNQLVIDPSTPVLVHAGYIESARLDWLRDPEKIGYVLAPLSAYPIEGRIVPLPFAYDKETEPYLEEVTTETLLTVDRFVVVTHFPFIPARAWLDARLSPEGFTSRTEGQFLGMTVTVYERDWLP